MIWSGLTHHSSPACLISTRYPSTLPVLFKPALLAIASWLIFRVAHLDDACRPRLENQPTGRRRHASYLRLCRCCWREQRKTGIGTVLILTRVRSSLHRTAGALGDEGSCQHTYAPFRRSLSYCGASLDLPPRRLRPGCPGKSARL